MAERFERHSRTFSLLTLVSRCTGLARDAVFSRLFGARLELDAFFFAFLVPNLFRRLFGEGALAAAFLPEYAQQEKRDPAVARRLATLTVAGLLVGLGALTLAGEAALWLLRRGDGTGHLALSLLMIMLPYMPLVCLVAILGALLQVHGRFGPGAAAPIVLNLCLIAAASGGAWGWPEAALETRVVAVAAAVVVAGLGQVAWMLFALRRGAAPGRATFGPLRGPPSARAPLRALLRRAGPMFLGLGVLQLNTFLDSLIASYPTTVGPTVFGLPYPLTEGALTAVSFAQRLYQFPLGVFGLAVATAIFPALARAHGDGAAFGALVARGLRLVVFFGLPASAGLALVGGDLATVILEGGAFGGADSRRVALILLGYAAGVWAYSMIHVLTRAFYASGDTATPVRVAVGMVALNLTLNCTLIWTPLREAGLAWSTSACAMLQVSMLLAVLARRTPAILDRVGGGWMRTLAITAVMALAVIAVGALLPERDAWGSALLRLGARWGRVCWW